jgi:hypothetical protein
VKNVTTVIVVLCAAAGLALSFLYANALTKDMELPAPVRQEVTFDV